MTSQSPRIYIYKITFEEVKYYYYGVHKEKRYNEYYMGSPVTHKWVWNFYTPKKQILQVFDYTDEGWLEAQEVEIRLIKPFYNTDKWCLNESCGGIFSLEVSKRNMELGIGFAKLTTEQRREIGKKNAENKKGIHGLSIEEKILNGKKCYELGVGFHSFTTEERQEIGRRVGKENYELGIGFAKLTTEERREIGKTNYKNGIGIAKMTTEERKEIGRSVCFQKWMCTKTGYIANPGNLSKYQKKRNIDTSNRVRIK